MPKPKTPLSVEALRLNAAIASVLAMAVELERRTDTITSSKFRLMNVTDKLRGAHEWSSQGLREQETL